MNVKEQAKLIVNNRKKVAEENQRTFLESLRKDAVFDQLCFNLNSKKWNYVKSVSQQQKEDALREIEENEKAIVSYLESKGLGAESIKPKYFCKKCNDTGEIDGKECECIKTLVQEIVYKENPLLKEGGENLSGIDFDFYGEEKDIKRKYAEYLDKTMSGGEKAYYLLVGKTGTAKTYIALTALKQEFIKGRSVKAISSIKLNKSFLNYHCARIENKDALWQEIAGADVMLIDDLGVEQLLNNVTVPYLYELLIDRLDKVTFITTNLDVIELEKRYGQRILSRLLDKKLSTAINFKGKDLRFN